MINIFQSEDLRGLIAHVAGEEPYDLHHLLWHMFPGLDLYSTCTDLTDHLLTGAIVSIVHDIYRDVRGVNVCGIKTV